MQRPRLWGAEALGQAKTLLCAHTLVCPKAQWEIHRSGVRARQRKGKTSSGGRGGEAGLGAPPLLRVRSSLRCPQLGPPFPAVSLTTQSTLSSSRSSGFAQPGRIAAGRRQRLPLSWRGEVGGRAPPCSDLKRPSPGPGGLLGQPSPGGLPGPSLVPVNSCSSENPQSPDSRLHLRMTLSKSSPFSPASGFPSGELGERKTQLTDKPRSSACVPSTRGRLALC